MGREPADGHVPGAALDRDSVQPSQFTPLATSGARRSGAGRLRHARLAVGADPQARGKAVRTYESLVSIDPANTEGLYQLAFLQLLAGKFRESRALLDRLPSELQTRPQVLAVRAAALAGLGDPSPTATLTTLEQHPDLTAADVLSIVPAFDHIKDPSVLRRMLETLDRRNLATPETLQALGVVRPVEPGRFSVAGAHLSVGVALLDLGMPHDAAVAAQQIFTEHGRQVAEELTELFRTRLWPAYQDGAVSPEQLRAVVERFKPVTVQALVTAYEAAVDDAKRETVVRRTR